MTPEVFRNARYLQRIAELQSRVDDLEFALTQLATLMGQQAALTEMLWSRITADQLPGEQYDPDTRDFSLRKH